MSQTKLIRILDNANFYNILSENAINKILFR
jgi:hypothetical protein